MDAIKKSKFYGKQLDKINLIEELGDVMWYCALLCHELNTTFEEVWDKNIRKLKVRYPKAFTSAKAKNRNTNKERVELEN